MSAVVLSPRHRLDRPPGRRNRRRLTWSLVDPPVRQQPQASQAQPAPVLILADAREVRLDDQIIPFTRVEFDLLLFLATNPRRVFTRDQLLERVWGFARGGLRTVDVHIRRLRAKLPDRSVAITVRGVGYRLADDANLRVVRLPPATA